jgi:uncharacterized SAM-binding protein YcdF (DUF218 family)
LPFVDKLDELHSGSRSCGYGHRLSSTDATMNDGMGMPQLSTPSLRVAIVALLVALHGALLWPANGARSQVSRSQPRQADFVRAQIAAPETLTGVIALGGGEDRIREAGRLARLFPHIRVVVSGDDPRRTLQLLGANIDRSRIQIEVASRNTHENAVNTTNLVKPAPGERWLLVTSASHMPRALCSFSREGFHVEPWPIVERFVSQKQRDDVLSREQVALSAYQLLGWCDAP